jgi:hypothetical protein
MKDELHRTHDTMMKIVTETLQQGIESQQRAQCAKSLKACHNDIQLEQNGATFSNIALNFL